MWNQRQVRFRWETPVSSLRGDMEDGVGMLRRAAVQLLQTELSCCPLHHRTGREPEPITSAVQRSFLDRFGHGSAKESDDGTRVVAAYHSAARHNHVGSGLTQIRNKKIFSSKKEIEPFAWRVSESLTSAHLWMVSGPTPPSTSMSKDGNWLLNQLTWVRPETRKTLSTKLLNAQREGSRDRTSVWVSQIREREMLRLIFIY